MITDSLRHSRARPAALASVLALALLLPAILAPQADAHTKAAKPSIKITGISVNMFNATPGTKITYQPNNPPNACYDIGGPSQTPHDVTVVFFINAVGIPTNAKTTVQLVTPWNELKFPDSTDPQDKFSETWFRDKGHGVASIFGGSDLPDNFYKYDDEGTGSNIFNGNYAVSTTVEVHGKVLRAHASIKVDCNVG
jgi:hypothetical protein